MFEQIHFLETIRSNVADSEMRRTYNRKFEFSEFYFFKQFELESRLLDLSLSLLFLIWSKKEILFVEKKTTSNS